LLSPKDEIELAQMMRLALRFSGPIAIRYARGGSLALSQPLRRAVQPIVMGQAELVLEGEDVAFLALGSMVYPAIEAARLLNATHIYPSVVNARFVKPLDRTTLRSLAAQHPVLITLEEAALDGGFGSAVLEAVEEEGLHETIVHRIGVPTAFVEHGQRDVLLEQLKLTPSRLAEQVRGLIQRRDPVPAYVMAQHG